jgi:D-alanyl-D-alanine carboxypeptidase
MRRWRRVLGLLLAAVLLAHRALAGDASIAVDAASGAVLESKDATALWRPASLTKLMTLYVVFEEVAAGHLDLDDKLTVSAYAAAMPASAVGLRQGEKITVKQAILATITRSANDAAVALAERAGGDEPAFAARMTRAARRLGMVGSTFRNATGLPDPDQTTTARDMAVLALALIRDFPQYYHFFAARAVALRGASLPTINAILYLYADADGLKTGFTCDSGYNLVASAVRGGRRVVAVLLGGLTSDQRYRAATKLLDAGFATQPQEDPTTLNQLTQTAADPPPQQLSDEACTPGWTSQPEAEVAGRLPGWGITFGGFPRSAPTRFLLERTLNLLPANLRNGRGLVVGRSYQGVKSFRAVVVGLSQAQAAGACHLLWRSGSYCIALPPAVLNNPKAAWR